MDELIKMPFQVWTNHALDGVKVPHGKGQFWRLSEPIKSGMSRVLSHVCLFVLSAL